MSAPSRTPLLIKKIIDFLFKGEGFRSKPYKDSKGVPTIGKGTTIYPNGSRVRISDPPCTEKQADEWVQYHLDNRVFKFVDELCQLCPNEVPEQVYIALCSFAYNEGAGWLKNDSFKNAMKVSNWGTFDEKTRAATGLAGVFLRYVNITIDGHLVFSQGLYNRRVLEIKFMLDTK